MGKYIVHKAVELAALSAKTIKSLDTPQNWILSPKYDGCHAVFLFDKGKHVGTVSRTGEEVVSLDHIAVDLLHVYENIIGSGKIAICGEAWSPDLEFNDISGLFRRHSSSPTLKFVPFDIVAWRPSNTPNGSAELYGADSTTYLNRLGDLALYRDRASSVIQPVYTFLVGITLTEAMRFAKIDGEYYKGLGGFLGCYDGSVLARAGGTYKVGSGLGGEFIKCKPLISYTVKVTGAEIGFGTQTGKNTAALKFNLDGKEQKVSTGLTQDQVDDITKVGWVGKLIEVDAMGKTINGYLREPRFKGIRYDA